MNDEIIFKWDGENDREFVGSVFEKINSCLTWSKQNSTCQKKPYHMVHANL